MFCNPSKPPHLRWPRQPALSKHDYTCQPVGTYEPDLDHMFTTAKQALTSTLTLSFFNLNKPTRLCSHKGLGFVLQQKNGNNWALIQASSRFQCLGMPSWNWCSMSWAITKSKQSCMPPTFHHRHRPPSPHTRLYSTTSQGTNHNKAETMIILSATNCQGKRQC